MSKTNDDLHVTTDDLAKAPKVEKVVLLKKGNTTWTCKVSEKDRIKHLKAEGFEVLES